MRVRIKFPFKGSEEQFRIAFARWDNPRVTFVCSFDRHDTCDTPQFRQFLERKPNVKAYFNEAAGKIAAVNANMEDEEWDILILASADMIPQREDYDLRIAEVFMQRFPDKDGVLHLNDGNAGNLLNTLCIMDWHYYKRFDYIYHPSYQALWCDNEFMEVSRNLGRAIYVDECIIKHEWSEHDPLVCHNQRWWLTDQANFCKRKAKGFPSERE